MSDLDVIADWLVSTGWTWDWYSNDVPAPRCLREAYVAACLREGQIGNNRSEVEMVIDEDQRWEDALPREGHVEHEDGYEGPCGCNECKAAS